MAKIPHYQFVIGEVTEDFRIEGKKYIFKITKGEEVREYEAERYFDFILEGNYHIIDNEKSFKKKLIILASVESFINRKIRGWGLDKLEIDFSGLFKDINLQEKTIRAFYESSEKKSAFWSGATVAIIAALIGVTPQIIQEFRKCPQESNMEFPKIVDIHDTIYMPLKSDTSLVRLVKAK